MPRPKPDPDLVAKALELLAGGCSLRETAETLGVSAPTVKRWAEAPPPSAAPSSPPLAVTIPEHMRPPPPGPPIDVSDPLALVRQMIQEQHAAIQVDRASNNTRGAASNAATLERMLKTLKQLEQANTSDAEVLRVPRAELALADATIEARIAALSARGQIRCCDCSRALSVEWGLGSASVADPDAQPIIP